MVDLGLNELSLYEELLILLLLKFLIEFVQQSNRIVIFVELVIKIGQVCLNLGSQIRTLLFVTPVDDVVAEVDQVLDLALYFKSHIEESTDDLTKLGLWEGQEKWQNLLCELDELFNQAFLLVDATEFISGLLFCSHSVLSQVVLRWCIYLDNLFKELDSATDFSRLLGNCARLYFFG